MRHYLLLANETATSPPVRQWALELVAQQPTRSHVHVVVPATRVARGLTWTEGESRAHAAERLNDAMAGLRRFGMTVDGEVGDENPILAADDALRSRPYDAVVVSTLPHGSSRWLRGNVVERLRRRHDVPVVHLMAEPVGVRA
ncbi:MAG: permease [Actinomycetota bacterium]|nr:permease [Actinomycetota bacterium]